MFSPRHLRISFGLVLCISVLINAAPPTGNIDDVTDVKIVDYGITKSNIIKTPKYENSVAGKVNVVNKDSIIIKTDTIPLEIGLSFGIRYEIFTKNNKVLKYPITYQVIYPSNMTNPEDGKSEKEWQFKTFSQGNKSVYTGFGFSEKYELLEGEWIFKVIVGNHIAQKSFILIAKK